MRRFLLGLFGGRLRTILVVSFSLIATITVSVGAVAISRTITDYRESAADDRVARDMDLARAFYDSRTDSLARVSRRLASSPTIKERLAALNQGEAVAIFAMEDELRSEIEAPVVRFCTAP